MTTVKTHLRLAALFLALFLLFPSFVSCQAPSSELPFELLDGEDTVAQAPLTLYRIVLPSSCSSALFSAANRLAKALTEQTGVRSEVIYDTEKSSSEKGCVELLLGRCDRTAATRAISDLRRDDYLCVTTDGTVVLGGPHESATLNALARYCDELLPYATEYSLLPSSAGFLFRAEYEIPSITVNGFALTEYAIVYEGNASRSVVALANALQKQLSDKGGYELMVCSDAEFRGDRKQISLTLDSSEPKNIFRSLAHEHGITLSAYDTFGLSVAVSHWSERLLSSEQNAPISVTLQGQEHTPFSYTKQTIASLQMNSESTGTVEISAIYDQIQAQLPDLVFAEGFSEQQQNTLLAALSESYTRPEDFPLLRANAVCQKHEGTAALYELGEGEEAFLLLYLNEIPSAPLTELLPQRRLPLVVLLHGEADATQALPTLPDHRMTSAHVEHYTYQDTSRVFAVYTELDCFAPIEVEGSLGYRSVAIHRSSALYPTPT